jgi:hypothetical protein
MRTSKSESILTSMSSLYSLSLTIQNDMSNHQRGLIISNRSGMYQLYAWIVPNGKLREFIQHSSGKEKGEISSDRRHVYYLNDIAGDETGHFVCVNLTPDAKLYSALDIQTDCI